MNFANGQKLQAHLERHLSQFPGFTADDYVARASALLNMDVGGDIRGFTGKTGRVYRYDAALNDYAVGNKGGTILTLFKPSDGMTFWNEKVEKYGDTETL